MDGVDIIYIEMVRPILLVIFGMGIRLATYLCMYIRIYIICNTTHTKCLPVSHTTLHNKLSIPIYIYG